jgi:hypothetical protein
MPPRFGKIVPQVAKLMVEQAVGLVDATDGDVGNHPGPASLEIPAMPIAYDGRKPII